MKKLIFIAILGTLLFPSLSFAQDISSTPTHDEIVASLQAQLQILLTKLIELLTAQIANNTTSNQIANNIVAGQSDTTIGNVVSLPIKSECEKKPTLTLSEYSQNPTVSDKRNVFITAIYKTGCTFTDEDLKTKWSLVENPYPTYLGSKEESGWYNQTLEQRWWTQGPEVIAGSKPVYDSAKLLIPRIYNEPTNVTLIVGSTTASIRIDDIRI